MDCLKRIKTLLGVWIVVGMLGMSHLVQAQADTTITIKILGGLQFDTPRLAVKPNTKLTIVLDNHDDMAHNMVVTKPNARLKVVEEAAKLDDKGAKMHYVPNSPLVIAHTSIVEPGQMETFSFVLDKPGIYPYVCTYPGHGYVMYGAIYVGQVSIPSLEKDTNIPEGQRGIAASSPSPHAHHHDIATPSPHPFPLEYPLLYRTFMPEAGPAAIVVGLTPTESYCFDAGKCYLRYAWTGGFVDNSEQWKGNGSKLSKIVGEVYWRENEPFPFRIKTLQQKPTVAFKGYTLQKRLPTFHYRLGAVKVTETLRWDETQMALIREWTFSAHAYPLFIHLPPQTGLSYQISGGNRQNEWLKIPAKTQKVRVVMKRLL